MRTLKIAIFSIYAAWVVAGTMLWALGLVGPFVGLSFIWFPLGLLFTVILFVAICVYIGDNIKDRAKPCCENCVYSSLHDVAGSCIGEKDGCIYGTVCKHYSRGSWLTHK